MDRKKYIELSEVLEEYNKCVNKIDTYKEIIQSNEFLKNVAEEHLKQEVDLDEDILRCNINHYNEVSEISYEKLKSYEMTKDYIENKIFNNRSFEEIVNMLKKYETLNKDEYEIQRTLDKLEVLIEAIKEGEVTSVQCDIVKKDSTNAVDYNLDFLGNRSDLNGLIEEFLKKVQFQSQISLQKVKMDKKELGI